MNRRGFLRSVLTAAAGVTISSLIPDDPERLLWVPGAKTIFLPPDQKIVEPTILAGSRLLKKGDVFTIDGVFAINPATGARTAHLQQFVVTSDVASGVVETNLIYPRPRDIQGERRATPLASWLVLLPA